MNPQQYRVWVATCAVQLLAAGWAAAQTPDANVDSTDIAYPVVITPTRLRQSLADVPASVTVITADTIRRYGITNIADALRLVPGMAVSRATGNDYKISYHGTYGIAPRRMNLLIDGVSAYRASVALVDWALLPVAMEDIDRIEVIRGPDSSAYGPNSMMAIINILTKHPKDVERNLAAVSVGSHNEVETTLRMATTLGSTSLRATVNTQRDSGYDDITLKGGGHDSTNVKRLNLRSQTDLNDGSTLELQASYVGGLVGVGYVEPMETSPADSRRRDTQFSGRWTKSLSASHEIEVTGHRSDNSSKQSWQTCWPQLAFLPEVTALFDANPDYLLQMLRGNLFPTGGTLNDDTLAANLRNAVIAGLPGSLTFSCGQANQDGSESRTQIEVQDTYVASDQLRFVSGLGMRYQRGMSQTFLGGSMGNSVRWAFGHAEYRPLDWMTTNLGAYVESNSLSGSTFSPRVAVNARLSDHETVRAVYSKGTRTPDLFEEHAVWSYTLTGLTPPPPPLGTSTQRVGPVLHLPGGLSSERITSVELGYLLTLRKQGLNLDTRIFDDRLSRLVPHVDQLINDNSGGVRLTGAEAQLTWDFAPGWSGLLNYAYLLNRNAKDQAETMQYSRHSGAIGISHAWTQSWLTSLAFYGASGDGLRESRYARTDLNVAYAFSLGGMPGSASVVVSYLDQPSVDTFISSFLSPTSSYTASFNRRISLHGTMRLTF